MGATDGELQGSARLEDSGWALFSLSVPNPLTVTDAALTVTDAEPIPDACSELHLFPALVLESCDGHLEELPPWKEVTVISQASHHWQGLGHGHRKTLCGEERC